MRQGVVAIQGDRSKLPSAREICEAVEGWFITEHWENFGADYDLTLMQWFRNFQENWNTLRTRYDERFFRMWKYYLLSCAGSFRARVNRLWQIVLSPRGVPGGYHIADKWPRKLGRLAEGGDRSVRSKGSVR